MILNIDKPITFPNLNRQTVKHNNEMDFVSTDGKSKFFHNYKFKVRLCTFLAINMSIEAGTNIMCCNLSEVRIIDCEI